MSHGVTIYVDVMSQGMTIYGGVMWHNHIWRHCLLTGDAGFHNKSDMRSQDLLPCG